MVEGGEEVCLEEEVERLRREGMPAAEISRRMGVDESWVEELVARGNDVEAPTQDNSG